MDELEMALNEMTTAAVSGALPRVFDPKVLEDLRRRYRTGLQQNVEPGKWSKYRAGALQASWSVGVIAGQIAAIRNSFEIDHEAGFTAGAVVEHECARHLFGKVCAGLTPIPPPIR